MRGGPIGKDVFHLKEFVGSVSSDDCEPEALGAFSKRGLQDGALQLGRISREGARPPAGLLCCTDDEGKRRREVGERQRTIHVA